MLFPGQKTTRALESTAQYSISALRMVGQLLERMMSLASPDLRDLRVDLYPSTYLPLLMTSASLLLMFSLPTFFTITTNQFIQYIHRLIYQYIPHYRTHQSNKSILLHPFMRRYSQKQHYLFPQIKSGFLFEQPSLEELTTLQKYQMQFSESAKRPIVNFRVKRTFTEVQDKGLVSGLKQVTREIKDLKKEIRQKRYTAKDDQSYKLGRLLSEVEDGMYRNKSMMPANFAPVPQQPVYVPVPFPMYMPQPPPVQPKESFYNRTSRKKTDARFGRAKKNVRKWRKVANCLLFYFYLRRFCRVARLKRKITFDKYLDRIKANLNGIKKLMNESLEEFYSIILAKQSVSFDFEEGDNLEVVKQKVASLRKLVGLILQCLLECAVQISNRSDLVESLYFLCRHGNFSCFELLMTKEELEITCISTTFKYVSADSHLQKSGLLNLVIFKLLLYNSLLSPSKLGPKFTQNQIPQNLYAVSSILYQFCIDYQDEEMLLVNPIYSIGNYESVEKVRVLESIIVKQGDHRDGDLISGLKDQRWVKKYFKFQNWSQEKKNLKQTVEVLHQAMVKYHSRIIQPYF